MKDRIPADADLAWEDFHRVVNMTSDELRTWLLTDASGEEAFPEPGSGPGVSELGARVVDVLRKRKVDLTDRDAEVMRQVVDYVEDRLENRPPNAERDDEWRHALMTVGHDPLRPEPSSA
ncbi:uncharacterized protein DUF3140 [Actinomadura pelletieri DSM 43383]|uniref:DUF3140 domain-containing protein n=2 Tax=Actinomadura TaxID=1988 RepID=A0A372GPI2_9ACTN|nr:MULTISPECIES: DUF3140 domain-containing protein [Actinomadura]RFS87225.1 DUF3140 domain-containing protein [Actinomadura spongiicola]RKS79024.1 uncharacterized protein DUF3140 [Actinomadura pelletieri DSM 43383]